jgi:ribosome-binding protein aMBF1 (putative translation factor)
VSARVGRQFGRNLCEARGWAGLTQMQLAQRVSIGQSEIDRLERGERCPRLDTVVELAEAVEVQMRDLLFEIE